MTAGRPRGRLVLIALVALALGAPTAKAATAEAQEVATRVAQQIMSPFCPGLTLHDCPSDAAADLRERIVTMASQGSSESEIIAELEREYGPGIRAVPQGDRFGLLAWAIPSIFVILGFGAVAFAAKRWSSRSTATPEDPPLSPDDRARVAREVANLRDEGSQVLDEPHRRALEAIIELEDDVTSGKLTEADFEALRTRYEADALRALKRLENMRVPQNIGVSEGGLGGSMLDEQLEAEIAAIRATMACATCGDVKRADGTCPTCTRS